jgi:hypothetical protein
MHEGIPLPLIERQLGHSHLSTTGTYLEGINTEEIISTVHARRAPMMHASAGLALWQAPAGAPRSRTPAAAHKPSSSHTPEMPVARCGRRPRPANFRDSPPGGGGGMREFIGCR